MYLLMDILGSNNIPTKTILHTYVYHTDTQYVYMYVYSFKPITMKYNWKKTRAESDEWKQEYNIELALGNILNSSL